MATYDNKAWLLKTVRSAFIATDDTSLCEIVMAGEDFSKIFQNKAIEEKKQVKETLLTRPSTSKESGTDEEDEKEIVTQFDPYPNMEDSDEDDMMYGSCIRYEEFGGHRYKTILNYDSVMLIPVLNTFFFSYNTKYKNNIYCYTGSLTK